MNLTYKEQIEIVKKICMSFSKNTGLPFENLFSECLSKLQRVNNNFIPELGRKFAPYLKASMRGYLKNYVRDKSFTTKIPRRILDIYMKTRKYSSHYIASIQTNYSLKDISDAHEIVSKYRHYNTHELQSWTTEINTFSSNNIYEEACEVLKEANVSSSLLLDFYVYNKKEKDMCLIYGENYKEILENDTEKLKKVCKSQGYA